MPEGPDIQESEPYRREGVGLLPNLVVALIGDWASHGLQKDAEVQFGMLGVTDLTNDGKFQCALDSDVRQVGRRNELCTLNEFVHRSDTPGFDVVVNG